MWPFNKHRDVPLCINCKWHSKTASILGWPNYLCGHPRVQVTIKDPVAGPTSFSPCCDRSGGPCGYKGKLFEKIPN